MTNTPQIDSSLLDQLSPQEREIALRALKEISSQGSSKLYNDLRYADYEELPVDVMTFLTDSRYLGRGLLNDNGDLTVFPYWQKLLVEMFPDPLKPCVYNTLALSGAIGLGKAQPLTSPVLTARGFIPMGSVTTDDLVYGQDGNLHKILGIFPQGRKQVYRISFSDHTSTLCCKDHLWKVKHSNSNQYQVLTTGELLAERLTDLAGRPRWSIPICQPINFPDSSKQLLDFTNITLDQPVPQKLLYSSISTRTSLICQLLKTGGYLSADDQSVYFSTANYQLSQDVIWLTQSLGGTGYLEDVTNQHYRVKLALPQIVYQSCDFFEWKTPFQSPERLIVDIQPAGEEFCQCILIDSPQHLYLTNDFIVTHNTMVAVLAMLYELYRMLCLKDPYNFYGLQPIDKITFALMNITLDASRGVAWDKLQQLVQSSPWFMSHGTVSGTTNVEWQPPKGIELVAGSQSRHIIGRAVFCAFFDEISFRIGQDIGKQKEQAKNLVNTAAVRMQSRFMKGEYNPTLLLLASSKRTESSYMEEFIAARKRQDSKTTRIIDEPQWIIRTDKDSPNKFKVAVGNKFLENELLPLNPSAELIQEYRDKGYQLLDVPMGYYEAFYEDINVALTDIAGISTSNSNRYFAGPRIATVKNLEYQNLFTKDIIEVGNGPNDTTQYWNYIDLSRLRRELISKPLYIHMDMSISGDKTGIAGVWIRGKKPPKEGEVAANDLFYTLAFSVSVKAPKGYQVSFEKNRQFIYWLKSKGFNIRGITTDSFQAADSGQALASKGYNYSMISVDRVDTDRICKPYQYLRSTIYEERVEIYDAPLLVEELIGLERDVGSGKIDHSPSGINSKDQADAFCGAVWRASQDADRYAFEYGEDIEEMVAVSTDSSNNSDTRHQIQVDFEAELQKITTPASIKNQQKKDQETFLDFGNGPAEPIAGPLIGDGMIIW